MSELSKKPSFVIIIAAAMAFREILRKNELFEQADTIRDALATFGVKIEDKK